jgi:hypothetical protein
VKEEYPEKTYGAGPGAEALFRGKGKARDDHKGAVDTKIDG